MPKIYTGSTQIKKVYAGSTQIKKVYAGSVLVYQSTFRIPGDYTGAWSYPATDVYFSTANQSVVFNMTNYLGLTNAQLNTANMNLHNAGYNYLRFTVGGLSLQGNSVALVGCCNSTSTILGYTDIDPSAGVGLKITTVGTYSVNISSLATGKFNISLWGSSGNANITLTNCYFE